MIVIRKYGNKPAGKKIAFSTNETVQNDFSESQKHTSQLNCYDLIGDVHGYMDLLDSLVEKMGYSRKGKGYEHPEGRKLIFVGDLINRGPDSISVLKTVRETWEQGNALLTLGNHEFNLLQDAKMNKPLPNQGYQSYLSWLEKIPLFLDLEDLRVVHAAWHFPSISFLSQMQVPHDEIIRKSCDKSSPERKAVDLILKGVKAKLPTTPCLHDRFGETRTKGRLRWWENLEGKPFSKALFSPMYGNAIEEFPKAQDIRQLEPYSTDEKPVFTGHYCLEPHIEKINGNIACLDGCVTYDKILWGYRHTSGWKLAKENLIYSEY
tara:strand:+ start:3243 stop:4205 length:963 start_codon:yes stop_codon:yes gene_type:complete